MFEFVSKIFEKNVSAPIVEKINALEDWAKGLSDGQVKEESLKLKNRFKTEIDQTDPESVEKEKQLLMEILPNAFALVREASRRVLGQRHYDVQLMGGIELHLGRIAEMRTGEGKTLAATLPAYLNALTGKGVHVVTVNEYLAKRDTQWMGRVYDFLGLSVGCLIHDGGLFYDISHSKAGLANSEKPIGEREKEIVMQSFLIHGEFLKPISRREAYKSDITYGTNHEFGFDYLRDNLSYRLEDQVQRNYNFAIIDEVDSILIDEARTPLIISAADQESSQFYKVFSRLVNNLKRDEDYTVDEKAKSVDILPSGIEKVEKSLNIKSLYDQENLRLNHYFQECLRAKEIYLKDRDYVVKQGEILIVDQFTGRLMIGRRYSGGLHQAIEAKEGVMVKQESRTYATISIQNYFRLYKKIAGMTGTASTSAEEFDKVYNLKVVPIPTHAKMIRTDLGDLVYKTKEAKYNAIVEHIKERNKNGQPVLIGTVSIEKNEELSRFLSRAGLKHEVLNAKNNEGEGAIIAQAGKFGGITVATNMAGRGVDIILGGNPPKPEEAEKVKNAGGLHVVGTERHESRRIDNQLRGRAGRQGDQGSSQFFLSLEDDLMRIFGGDRIKKFMEAFKMPDEMPIESRLIGKVISQAQAKVEGMNFDSRKHLLEYDDVLNKQRTAIYKMRQEMLKNGDPQVKISVLDNFWLIHLESMEALRESVYLRAYGQHDPLVEYRREGHIMYKQMMSDFENWIRENSENLNIKGETNLPAGEVKKEVKPHQHIHIASNSNSEYKNVGRNEPCPCGAKHSDGRPMKFKQCHGKNQ